MKHGKPGIVIYALVGAALSLCVAQPDGSFVGRGKTFGMVGFNTRMSSGTLFDNSEYSPEEEAYRVIDPFFRTGYGFMPGLAVGAELRLVHTFPVQSSAFRNIPSFSFGPSAMLTRPALPNVHWYLTATAGMSYKMQLYGSGSMYNGWDLGASAGMVWLPASSLGLGLEASWYYDAVRGWDEHRYTLTRIWREGNTISLGLRLCGVKP